jgi:hypothetical protein|tara:strand:+ start:247 stop:681 length:435 start_codon:yes stop_codon:yes gene_type:complete
MWQSHSEKRLVAWADLRNSCKENPSLDEVITTIHDWWQQAPMVLHYLHCDLVDDWPDPWDLIAENTYCSLAKCLGMCYTIRMLGRQDVDDVCILEIDNNDYIVQINNGLYCLNWNIDKVVNMKQLENIEITRNIDSAVFAHKIR